MRDSVKTIYRSSNVALFWIELISILMLFPLNVSLAAEEQGSAVQELSNPFSDYVPFEDEYDVDEDERFMYFGRFFAVSLGTGIQEFGGNMGKLYNTAVPVMDFRLLYFFDFRLAGQLGINSATHAFDADPSGYVEVNIMSLRGDLKYYFDTKSMGAAISTANPYIIGGIANTFRTQTLQDMGRIEKDNALALSAGLGMEFALKPRKSSIGIEGRMHQIYFRDRFSDAYSISGVPDMTGNMYSLTTSVIFFF